MCEILYIEDDADSVILVTAALRNAAKSESLNLRIESVPSLREANRALAHRRFDAIILDLTLHDSTADETLAWAETNTDFMPPMVVLTGSADLKGTRAKAFAAGAQEVIFKQDASRMPLHLLQAISDSILRRRAINKSIERRKNAG